jgi:hypothetical protein
MRIRPVVCPQAIHNKVRPTAPEISNSADDLAYSDRMLAPDGTRAGASCCRRSYSSIVHSIMSCTSGHKAAWEVDPCAPHAGVIAPLSCTTSTAGLNLPPD